MIAIAGMDPMRWMDTEDDVERIVMQAIAKAYFDLRAEANKA
jgi:hypothetical protein